MNDRASLNEQQGVIEFPLPEAIGTSTQVEVSFNYDANRVLTVGGLLGTIVGLGDDTVELEPAPGIRLTFVRAAISRTMPENDTENVDLTDSERPDTPELGA